MPLTEAQKADRTGFIGGSDAAVIVGLSPFKDADTLLLEKAGMKEPDDGRFTGHKAWGTLLEPVVRDYTATELGCEIVCGGPFIHPQYPFITGSLDGLIYHRERPRGIYEGKATAFSQKAKWKDAPPPEYHIQVVHYMLVTGFTWAVIAVLIGGNDYRLFQIVRDDEEVQALLTLELRFWDRVQALRAQRLEEEMNVQNQ